MPIVPGEERSKGNINKDDNALYHELQIVIKDIQRLNKRRQILLKLLKGTKLEVKNVPDSWFERPIWLYVLELEDGKYYVGMTRDVDKRFARHARRKGANWTKLHAPIRILRRENTKLTDEYEVAILENELTFETAIQYGLDNVRGGGYCQMHPNWPSHLYDQVFGRSAKIEL